MATATWNTADVARVARVGARFAATGMIATAVRREFFGECSDSRRVESKRSVVQAAIERKEERLVAFSWTFGLTSDASVGFALTACRGRAGGAMFKQPSDGVTVA
jgi:hypothetical protein